MSIGAPTPWVFVGGVTKGSVRCLSSPCISTPCRGYWGASLLKSWDSSRCVFVFNYEGRLPHKNLVMGSTPAGDAYCSKALCGFPQQTCRYHIGGFPRLHYLSSASAFSQVQVLSAVLPISESLQFLQFYSTHFYTEGLGGTQRSRTFGYRLESSVCICAIFVMRKAPEVLVKGYPGLPPGNHRWNWSSVRIIHGSRACRWCCFCSAA